MEKIPTYQRSASGSSIESVSGSMSGASRRRWNCSSRVGPLSQQRMPIHRLSSLWVDAGKPIRMRAGAAVGAGSSERGPAGGKHLHALLEL